MFFSARRYQENKVLNEIVKYIADLIMVVVTGYCLVLFLTARTTIVGSSMDEALYNGDYVLINQVSYIFSEPSRYDVIAFKQDSVQSSKIYVKRVVGLPGEKVQIKDGAVYINGNKLEDDIDTEILTAGFAANEITLGDDEFFVLGDNRNNSEDSRFSSVGVIKEERIVGKVWFIMSPFNRLGFVS
ncbi:MAG: signal peptidase I [Lachnospira sp.]